MHLYTFPIQYSILNYLKVVIRVLFSSPAASCGHSEVLTLLLANGADKNRTDSNGDTPLDICDSSVRHLLVQ